MGVLLHHFLERRSLSEPGVYHFFFLWQWPAGPHDTYLSDPKPVLGWQAWALPMFYMGARESDLGLLCAQQVLFPVEPPSQSAMCLFQRLNS